MDTKVVEVRKNILISVALVGSSSFTQTINNVPFIPDEVLIRTMFYNPTAPDTVACIIYSDLVSDNLGLVYQNTNMKQGIRFILKKPVSGTYTFKILTSAGATNNVTGNIFIHFDFVKYSQTKEQKVL